MQKACFIVLRALNLYFKANEEAYAGYYTVIKHSGHLRTLVFSNDHRVLSQCNTRLRLLYLLNNKNVYYIAR